MLNKLDRIFYIPVLGFLIWVYMSFNKYGQANTILSFSFLLLSISFIIFGIKGLMTKNIKRPRDGIESNGFMAIIFSLIYIGIGIVLLPNIQWNLLLNLFS